MKEKVIRSKSLPDRIKKVRKAILSAGNTIGSVHFVKRTDHSLRKMAYRLHVKNPSCAPAPATEKQTKYIDRDNLQMTVLDTNKVVRDRDGNIIGRGAYRTIPLENVERVVAKGTVYTIEKE